MRLSDWFLALVIVFVSKLFNVVSKKCNIFEGEWIRSDRPWIIPRRQRGIEEVGFNQTLYSLSGKDFIGTGMKGLYCRDQAKNAVLRDTVSWEWRTNCNLHPFSSSIVNVYMSNKHPQNSFKRGKKMYIIGDSVNLQLFQTIQLMFKHEIDIVQTKREFSRLEKNNNVHIPWPKNGDSKGRLFGYNIIALKGGGIIEFLLSDKFEQFSKATEITMETTAGNTIIRPETAFTRRLLEDSRPGDIVVLNTGPHHPLDYDKGTKLIRSAFEFLKNNFSGPIIYRDNYNTVSDKYLCLHNFTAPNNHYQLNPKAVMFNKIVREVINDLNMKKLVMLLEIDTMSSQRCDRPDELHFCVPGPQFEWVRLLFQLLWQ